MRKMLSHLTSVPSRGRLLPGVLVLGALQIIAISLFAGYINDSLRVIIRNGGFITVYILGILCLGLGSFLAEAVFGRREKFTEEILLYLRSEATTLGLMGSLIAITYEGSGTILRLFSEGKAPAEAFSFLFHSWNSTIAGLVASHLSYILLKVRDRNEKEKN